MPVLCSAPKGAVVHPLGVPVPLKGIVLEDGPPFPHGRDLDAPGVPPLDPETPDCDYAAKGIVSIWSRRNWAGER